MPFIPALLLILDGYGLAPRSSGNAVSLARTPHLDRLIGSSEALCPGVVRLGASGRAVGLPAGYMGNSEVGHLNIGAGRVVNQDMTRIDLAVESGALATNPALTDLLAAIGKSGGRLHLLGLLSDGGVHSHVRHLEALMRIAVQSGVPVLLDLFTDGRDAPPDSGIRFVLELRQIMAGIRSEFGLAGPGGVSRLRLATLCGRYYAMDRDRRWDRVRKAWDLLTRGTGRYSDDPCAALAAAYRQGETDEFFAPHLFGEPEDVRIRDGDGLFFFNFRADRARELVSAFHCPDFTGFERERIPELAGLATMTAYDSTFAVPVAFPGEHLRQTLGEVVSNLGLRQLRIAETEKYAHVTYFFSGGREAPFPGEERILVDSPRDVPTYDLKPEMSVHEVTARLLAAGQAGSGGRPHDFVVCNFANPDMVGHTGNIEASIRALEAVDVCVGRVLEFVRKRGWLLLVTADHGNSEELLDAQGRAQTAHTCNETPFLVLDGRNGALLPLYGPGRLGDIAPTLLGLWGVTPPPVMTGRDLSRPETSQTGMMEDRP